MIEKIIGLVKPFIPVKRKAIHNEVIVPREVAPPYRIVHDYPTLPFVTVPDYPRSEGGEVNAHKEYTRKGDDVIIIGGGRGVSTVNAAKEAGSTGSVTVFEGSEKYSRIIEDVVDLNNVDDRVEVRQCIVGPDKKVYDNSNDFDIIHPENITKCDVLEMDCEGAEEEIMKNLKICPRVITIEIHPKRSDYKNTLEELSRRGYKIENYWSNEGSKLTKDEFNQVIKKRSVDQPTEGAPLVTAIKN
jgi:hypothetical protein